MGGSPTATSRRSIASSAPPSTAARVAAEGAWSILARVTKVASVVRYREALLVPLACGAGLAIASLDSRPGWDATGITAALLILAAGGITALAGRRPWLWPILVGMWTPLVEMGSGGAAAAGALGALAFAALGGLTGYAIIRWQRALAE
jgi:hypothetical protein